MSKYAKSNRCDLRLTLLKFSKTISYDRMITFTRTRPGMMSNRVLCLNHKQCTGNNLNIY